MNENSPICARATATITQIRNGSRAIHMITNATIGLATRTMAIEPASSHGESSSDRRIEQHADRDEEQHREGIAHRQRVRGGAQAVVGSSDHHAGEERAERHRDAEDPRRSHGDAERDHQHGQREQLARSRHGDAIEEPRDDARADDRGEGDEGARPSAA